MKPSTVFCFLLGFLSCSSSGFVQDDADKPVVLTQDDLNLYDALKNEISVDLVQIRKVAKSLGHAYDTTFLGTNSYYLYQIGRSRYEPIISKLKNRNIYVDVINTSYDGTLEFRMKETSDERSLPHFDHTHALVFDPRHKYKPTYSGRIDVIKDSAINEKWRYVLFKAQVGH